tara:strand:+ start:342 stop:1076 length:735 start_codon:yes stop_codon:yes gene_type:complete
MSYHNTYIFDNSKFNIRESLEIYFKNKYNDLSNFENIHKIINNYKNINDFYNIIPIFGINDRKSPFVFDFYNFIDTDYTFLYNYLSFIKTYIKPLFPDESHILVQKTPNIRFHLPNCTNIGKRDTDKFDDIIGVHKDSDFGHHKEELNIIFPITQMYDSNSIYYEEYPNSNENLYNYNSMKLNTNNFNISSLNSCYHYNKINKTDITRVSLDFRIIPYSKFYDENKSSVSHNIKFKIGDYYMLI